MPKSKREVGGPEYLVEMKEPGASDVLPSFHLFNRAILDWGEKFSLGPDNFIKAMDWLVMHYRSLRAQNQVGANANADSWAKEWELFYEPKPKSRPGFVDLYQGLKGEKLLQAIHNHEADYLMRHKEDRTPDDMKKYWPQEWAARERRVKADNYMKPPIEEGDPEGHMW